MEAVICSKGQRHRALLGRFWESISMAGLNDRVIGQKLANQHPLTKLDGWRSERGGLNAYVVCSGTQMPKAVSA